MVNQINDLGNSASPGASTCRQTLQQSTVAAIPTRNRGNRQNVLTETCPTVSPDKYEQQTESQPVLEQHNISLSCQYPNSLLHVSNQSYRLNNGHLPPHHDTHVLQGCTSVLPLLRIRLEGPERSWRSSLAAWVHTWEVWSRRSASPRSPVQVSLSCS